MFDWLLNPLGSALAWVSSWAGSYAIALLFYALVFKLVFSFFSVKQQKNQIKMAKLAPKIAVIREKYKGRTDQVTMRKMQEEIMALQQKEGYSAFSGCLPLLIQLPIIIILYSVIREPLTYLAKIDDETIVAIYNYLTNSAVAVKDIGKIEQINLIGAINSHIAENGPGYLATMFPSVDFAALPNFMLWSMNLAEVPSFTSWPIVLIPFVVAIFQWLSMFISRKFAGNSQMAAGGSDTAQAQMSLRIMDLVMPLMTLWMAFTFSAMLGVYWIYQSIFGIIQTVILNLLMPIPKYTEEELRAMRRAQKTQEKAQRAAIRTQPKYKSLHYIDDDDYEDLREIKSSDTKKNTTPGTGSGNKPEIKD